MLEDLENTGKSKKIQTIWKMLENLENDIKSQNARRSRKL